MLKSINQFIALYVNTFKLFGKFKAWLLLFIIVAANWLLLYSHNNFTEPLFYGFITWWTNLWDAQYAGGFTHYPGHFILLSYYFSSAKLFLGLLIEGGLLGAASIILYKSLYSDIEKQNHTLKQNIKSWLNLSVGWAILNGILYAGYRFLPEIFSSFLWSSPRRQMIFDYGVIPFFNILVFAILFYTIPYIAIYRTNVLVGIKNSFRMFIKRPIFNLILSFSIMAVPITVSIIMMNPVTLVEKFKPEVVYYGLSLGLIVDLFVNFFWMGTAVNYISDEE